MDTTGRFIVLTAVLTVVGFGAMFAGPLGLFRAPRRTPDASGSTSAFSRFSGRTEGQAGETAGKAESDSAQESGSLFRPARVLELEEENERLQKSNAILENRLTAVLNWILVNFRGRFPLPERHMNSVRLDPLTDDFLLSRDLTELFKITGEEEVRINDAFAYAHDYLREIEAALITVTNPYPGKVILHIPTFSEHGEILQEDLYAALETTLGQNRFDRFMQVSEESLRETFYEFGEASHTMVFELAYVEGDPNPQLKVKDGCVIEVAPNVRRVTATETYMTNLPSRYYAYVAWLPEYMAAYAVE